MASNVSPAFAYTVVYVKDVAKSVAFYAKAFGHNVRRLDESHRWGELESGQTTIAFTPLHQHETDDLTGRVQTPGSRGERQPIEVCFAYPDVDAAYKGGFFNAIMSFPSNYPNSPPTVKFTSEIWHPNIYPDGRVCISILHPPGKDPNGFELVSERWTPVHTVESIVLSIISMLSGPNDESPANVEAAKEWRDRRDEFKKKVSRCVRKAQEML